MRPEYAEELRAIRAGWLSVSTGTGEDAYQERRLNDYRKMGAMTAEIGLCHMAMTLVLRHFGDDPVVRGNLADRVEALETLFPEHIFRDFRRKKEGE